MVRIKLTWKYLIAFYFIIMLYASLHELVHHFVGYFICGDWGYKTFNYFSTACEKEKITYLATYMGPVFSFAMMWVGRFFLIKKTHVSALTSHWAFALIFAQLPLQRMICPFFKMNDEYFASANLFGDGPIVYWTVIILIWIVCTPPLITAYRSISNTDKWKWFVLYFTFLPLLIWAPIFGLLEYLLINKHFLDSRIIGIAWLFILNEIVTILGYYATKKYLNPYYNTNNI